MTAVAIAIACALGQTAAPAQGVFQPANGPAQAWKINEYNTLLWNGSPYLPVGLRIEGSEAAIQRAYDAGVRDVLVELSASADWSGVVQLLEQRGMRYLIAVDSAAPASQGFVVDPGKYRVTEVKGGVPVEQSLPGVEEAYVMVVANRDNSVQWQGRVEGQNGRFRVAPELSESLVHTVFFYPKGTSLSQFDAWEQFDQHRDRLLTALRRAKLGVGYRGLVNPAGETLQLRALNERVIPTSAYYRMEMTAFLQERYRNLTTALRAWGVGANAYDGFEDLARLVPMWSETQGVRVFWDPGEQITVRCTSRTSSAWADIQTVLDRAMARRYERLVSAISTMTSAPIIQDWRGWASMYEGRSSLSGLAARTGGVTPFSLAQSGSRAASSVLRWNRPGWLISSRVDPEEGRNETSPAQLVEHLAQMGLRGFYFRDLDASWAQAVAQTAADPDWGTVQNLPLYYPENATSPAAPTRLPGNVYWYPSPLAGNSLDLGANFRAYRYADPVQPGYALWSVAGEGRVRLRYSDPKAVSFRTLDGRDPKPRVSRNAVEVTVGDLPLLISGTEEIPVPEISVNETLTRFERLFQVGDKSSRDVAQENYTFREAVQGFDRNPSGSFDVMRNQYWRLTLKLSPYVWMEAEGTRKHNFSDVRRLPGAAGDALLELRTLEGGTYQAEYQVPVRSEEDQTVWIAGRIPKEVFPNLRVLIGGAAVTFDPTPQAFYGQGLAWYKGGLTRITGTRATMTLEVVAARQADLLIDTLMIAPSNYRPDGAFPPELSLALTP